MAGKNTSPSKEFLVMKGTIEESLPSATFKVKLENGQVILCYLGGKMRMNRIRLTPGDDVQVEVSPYDLTKGRITYRL